MPNPAADETRAMSDPDLAEAINEAYRELFNLHFQRGTRQLQDPNAPRTARRQIARLRTILRERQIAAAAGAPIAPLAAGPDPESEAELEDEPQTAAAAAPDEGEPNEEEPGGDADAAADEQERG